MIKSITVTNYLNESLTIDLRNPEKSGFLIAHIEGLGPCKATINSTEMATGDGSVYNSSKLGDRNIVIQLAFAELPSVEYNRQKSYRYFQPKKPIKLTVETSNRYCEIVGRVEANEPYIFSPKCGSQISILCSDPYFYKAGIDAVTVTKFSSIEYGFEFPFSNESLTEPMIEFGVIYERVLNTVYYEGDSEVGIDIVVHSLGDVGNLTIYNTQTREKMVISADRLKKLTGSALKAKDTLLISTSRNNKSVRLLRDGKYTNVLNCLDRDASWFKLTQGDNLFGYTAETGQEFLQFQIENRTAYVGV